ncbi:MAG: PilT-like protein [Acidobacteriales bacterium]|nr:PilT-like protein [Terriglobales bacterium]
MRYLLDTSIFLWMVAQPENLNVRARNALAKSESELYLSAASCWEIVIKTALGRLQLESPPAQYIPRWQAAYGIRPLGISQIHALELDQLPAKTDHKDPFDRMLVAQARSEDMVLLTSDRAVIKYPVETLWCGKG